MKSCGRTGVTVDTFHAVVAVEDAAHGGRRKSGRRASGAATTQRLGGGGIEHDGDAWEARRRLGDTDGGDRTPSMLFQLP
jgi:hypothetical protein